MKPLFFHLLAFASGYVGFLLYPAASRSGGGVSVPGTNEKSATIPTQKFRTLSLEGDWKPAAEAWAAEDPEGFCRWLVERGMPPGPEVLTILFSAWVKRDVDAAFTAAFNLPADYRKAVPASTLPLLDQMLQTALNQTGGLAAIVKWLPQAEEQIDLWNETSGAWMKEKPLEETGALLAKHFSGNNFSGMMLHQFARHWAMQDPQAALSWVHSLKPNQGWEAFRGLLETWSLSNPAEALRYLATDATSAERINVHTPLAELAKTDPKAALAWWENNIGIPGDNTAFKIFREWGRNNVAEAFDYVLAMEDPTLRNYSLKALSGVAKPDALLKSLEGGTDTRSRQTMLEALSGNVVHSAESMAVLRNLAAQGPTSGVTSAIAARVSGRYAQGNPAVALEWVATLPEVFQAESVRAVFSEWSRKDKVAAALAAERLPEGSIKTAAKNVLLPK